MDERTKHDVQTAKDIGGLTTAVQNLTAAIGDLRKDFRDHRISVQQQFEEARRRMFWVVAKVSTGVLTGVMLAIEYIKGKL